MSKCKSLKRCTLVIIVILLLLSDLPLLMLDYFLGQVDLVLDSVGPVQLPLSYCQKQVKGSKIDIDFATRNWSVTENNHFDLQPGGRWKPSGCLSKDRVAIIVPYRNRKEHLNILLSHLHPFLQGQNLDYGIFVVEQDPKHEFNRGMLLNVGFLVANATYKYQCHVFHDVDHLPVNEDNSYGCPDHVRHLAVAVDKFNYKEVYGAYVGGVLALRTEDFEAVNGFSNNYFGWGGEDDDFFTRIQSAGLWLERPSPEVGIYRTASHSQAEKAKDRLKYLRISQKLHSHDGLNSLQVSDVKVERLSLHTWIYVVLEKSLVRSPTGELVKEEYEQWKALELAKKEEEERENKLRGNFKKMPPRIPLGGQPFS